MKIVDLKCALIGKSPIVRVVSDEGIDGFGQIEWSLPKMAVIVDFYRELLIGEDPTQIERCMLKIRRLAGFKPWGSAVSAIDVALHDLLGKALGVPIHKLLGGKVRDRVRVYNGGVRFGPNGIGKQDYFNRGSAVEDYVDRMKRMKAAAEGFTIIKESLAFHDYSIRNFPGLSLSEKRSGPPHPNRGPLTERGISHTIECIRAMKEVLGDEVGLALDLGPGLTLPDAIRIMRAIEPLNVMWGEDILTGNFVPWLHVDEYLELTRATSTPTHTGEQIYSRHNFRELIDRQAVRVIGPDLLAVGGIAELKWVAEFADLYGVQIAPHGVHDGMLGLAALVQVCATLPDNFIAFEYPVAEEDWWHDIVTGLPERIVVDGHIDVWDRPGLGIEFDRKAASAHLAPEHADFFA